MSAEKRSRVMARIRGKDTGPEMLLAAALASRGLAWEGHARDLPGRPDFVFRERKVAVFVDGDFWHGRNFGQWRHKLAEKWELKIASNRRRDRVNDRLLKGLGWRVVRIWEHQIESGLARSAGRVLRVVRQANTENIDRGAIDANDTAKERVTQAGSAA
jgi:DNA mismatch endonuclease (patch repair protein)